MSVQTNDSPNREGNPERIKRLKRIIRTIKVVIPLLPLVICIILFIRIDGLQKQIDRLTYSIVNSEGYVLTDIDEEDITQTSEDKETKKPQLLQEDISYPEDDLSANTRKVYLTFDDGPSSHTNEILDILSVYDVKATFFVIGKEGEEYEQLYKRIVEEGHTLAMHSYTHVYSEVYESVDSFATDVTKLQTYLYEVTGTISEFYRFPGGSSTTRNPHGIADFAAYLEDVGITYFDWNVSSGDASSVTLSADQIIQNCTKNIDSYNTAIILMHDAYGKSTTVQALPDVIEYIQSLEDTVLLPISGGTTPVHMK